MTLCPQRVVREMSASSQGKKRLVLAYPVFHELLRSCLLRFQPSSVDPSPALGLLGVAPGLFGEALAMLEDAWPMWRSAPDRSSVASALSEETPGWFGIAPGLATALLRASEAATTLLLTVLLGLVSAGTALAGTTSIPPVGLPAASKAGLLTYVIVTPSDCGVTWAEDTGDFSAEELIAVAAAAGC